MLNLPERTSLVIGLTNLDASSLPVGQGPDYDGISADFLLRGSRGRRDHGRPTVRNQRITAPLARAGISRESGYTLNPPFGPRGRIDTATGAFR